MTYVVARAHASHLFQNLLGWRMDRQKLLRHIHDEGGRYPHNPERWLFEVVQALNIPLRRISVCQMPVVSSRYTHNGLKVKEMVGNHILGGLNQLRLFHCKHSPFSNSSDPVRQYESRKIIHLEAKTNEKGGALLEAEGGGIRFTWGQRCSSCQPTWGKNLARMMKDPYWESFFTKEKKSCSPSFVCNDNQRIKKVSCYDQN